MRACEHIRVYRCNRIDSFQGNVELLPRNLNIILITFVISALCYVSVASTKNAILIGEAIQMIDEFYVDPVDHDALIDAAMTGLTSKLDEHSEYIPPQMYGAFKDVIEQEFAGVGILVEQPEPGKPVRVRTPLVASPALDAGIQRGDLIIKVNGEDVSTMSIGDVSNRLRGPVGTELTITVQRDITDSAITEAAATSADDATNNAQGISDVKATRELDIKLTRQRIELESVVGNYRNDQNQWVYALRDQPEIAYIRMLSFGEKTVAEIEKVLATAIQPSTKGLILDVRANSGGLLNAAVAVCDDLLDDGLIVTIKRRNDEIDSVYEASPGKLIDASLPMVVLVDQNSASASEIVAACLQDHGRAKIVGARTFGKGTVQNVLQLNYGHSALKLTTARYYRPNGRNIHRAQNAKDEDDWGVTPDEGNVMRLEDEEYTKLIQQWEVATFPFEATKQDQDKQDKAEQWTDTQLQRAVEVLMDKSQGAVGDDDQTAKTETPIAA